MREIQVNVGPSNHGHQQIGSLAHLQPPRCVRHPGVLMVLAGTNREWNTVRYLCPLCRAMNMPLVEVAEGSIKAFWPERGYGFIDTGGPDIFFHVHDVAPNTRLAVGLRVTCQVEQGLKGLIGHQVRVR